MIGGEDGATDVIGPAATQPCDVVLRDGSTLALRRAGKPDVDALVPFFDALSPESRYYRFFGSAKVAAPAVARLVPASSDLGMALVGECGGRFVAFAG